MDYKKHIDTPKETGSRTCKNVTILALGLLSYLCFIYRSAFFPPKDHDRSTPSKLSTPLQHTVS